MLKKTRTLADLQNSAEFIARMSQNGAPLAFTKKPPPVFNSLRYEFHVDIVT